MELSSLHWQLIGMMECWESGIMGLEDWKIGVMEKRYFFSC
jgi:hypothetical protein